MSITRFLTAGLCLFSLFSKAEPLYWQATRGDINYMLIGSIHLGDPSMYPLPDPLMKFLASSDGLIVEADLSTTANIHYPVTQLTSKQVLDFPQQRQLVKIADQIGVDVERLYRSAPWAAALTLQVSQAQQLGYQASLGIDQYLIEQAKQLTIPILGLESLQHQIDLLANLDQGGKDLLISTIENWDEANQSLPCLFESWIGGDQTELEAVTDTSAAPDEVARQLETERNQQWAEKLTQAGFLPHNSGNYLIAVGALHLIGQDNLLTLLEQKGFVVKQLNQVTPVSCIKK